jgi:hypothetical protein
MMHEHSYSLLRGRELTIQKSLPRAIPPNVASGLSDMTSGLENLEHD